MPIVHGPARGPMPNFPVYLSDGASFRAAKLGAARRWKRAFERLGSPRDPRFRGKGPGVPQSLAGRRERETICESRAC